MPKFFEIANKPRSPGEAQEGTAPEAAGEQVEQSANLMPPFMPAFASARGGSAPGVVPPPAAPVYSMRPPESASRAEGGAARASSAQATAELEVQEQVRVAMQRGRPAARRRAAQQPRPAIPRAAAPATRTPFDATRAAQAGLLNLAWRWQESGSPIRAIHAYMELITRYPETAAADAAVADLVALSEKLAEEGQFQTALAIYDRLEQLL